jgi:hypothetical protein
MYIIFIMSLYYPLVIIVMILDLIVFIPYYIFNQSFVIYINLVLIITIHFFFILIVVTKKDYYFSFIEHLFNTYINSLMCWV